MQVPPFPDTQMGVSLKRFFFRGLYGGVLGLGSRVWGFPKTRGTFLGVPRIRIIVY